MYPSVGRLKRCFYSQVVELTSRPYARQQYLAQLFILLYALFRASQIAWAISSPDLSTYARYDYILYLMLTYREYYDVGMVAVILLLEGFIFTNVTYHHHLQAGSTTVQWFTQLVVHGQDAYLKSQLSSGKIQQLRKQKAESLRHKVEEEWPMVKHCLPGWLRGRLYQAAARLTLWYTFGTINQATFARLHYVSLNPTMPVRLRLKLLQCLLLADQALTWLQLAGLLLFIIVFGLVYLQVHLGSGPGRLYWRVHYLFDTSLLLYQVFQLLYYSYFSIVAIQASVYMGASLMKGRLAQLRTALRKSVRKHPNASVHRQVEAFFYHSQPPYQVTLRGNVELSGPILFAYLLTNIPCNVYGIWRLSQPYTSLPARAVIGLILVAQVLGTAIVMLPMAKFAALAKAPIHVLPAVQGRLRPRSLPLKLKIEQMYETLRSGTIAITVGPLNPVTYGYILEFLYTYTGLLLMAFSEETSLNNLVDY